MKDGVTDNDVMSSMKHLIDVFNKKDPQVKPDTSQFFVFSALNKIKLKNYIRYMYLKVPVTPEAGKNYRRKSIWCLLSQLLQ